MSKLGSILQPRTLPISQQSILFSDCSPEVPAMFNLLLKSWQNTGSLPIVNVPSPEKAPLSQDDVKAEPEPVSHDPLDGIECHWMSRLAAEWQVGIETLVPSNATFTISGNCLTNESDTVKGAAESMIRVRPECEETVGSDHALKPKTTSDAPVTYLANKLIEAVQSGAASTVEQVLRLIDRQSQSSVVVLRELKEHLAKNSCTPLSVDWETGWDANANSFTRICFTLQNDWSKGSGATKLIIGSDGTTYATFTERWNSTPIYLAPNDALSKVKGSSLKRLRDFNRAPQRSHQSMPAMKTLKAPRHFKAAG